MRYWSGRGGPVLSHVTKCHGARCMEVVGGELAAGGGDQELGARASVVVQWIAESW